MCSKAFMEFHTLDILRHTTLLTILYTLLLTLIYVSIYSCVRIYIYVCMYVSYVMYVLILCMLILFCCFTCGCLVRDDPIKKFKQTCFWLLKAVFLLPKPILTAKTGFNLISRYHQPINPYFLTKKHNCYAQTRLLLLNRFWDKKLYNQQRMNWYFVKDVLKSFLCV